MNKTTYYCPCCGQPMESIVQPIELPHETRYLVQVTCYREALCQFATYTVSPDTANCAAKLTKYGAEKHYDVFTGKKID